MFIRLTFSLFIFSTILAAGGWYIASNINHIKNVLLPNPKQTQAVPPELFYKQVGAAPPPKIAKSPPLPSTFTLETAVHLKQNLAEADVDRLSEAGFQAFYTPYNKGGRVVYRVRVGVFKQPSEASQTQAQLKRTGVRARVISL